MKTFVYNTEQEWGEGAALFDSPLLAVRVLLTVRSEKTIYVCCYVWHSV